MGSKKLKFSVFTVDSIVSDVIDLRIADDVTNALRRMARVRDRMMRLSEDDELEALLWAVWEDFDDEMKCSKAFDPISELLSDPNTKNRLMTVPIVSLPANTPLQIAVDRIRQVVAGIVPTTETAISLDVLLAVTESERVSMHFNQSFDMLAWRNENMELNYNITVHSSGWSEV